MRNKAAYRAMARAVNPYGDGQAARRTAEALTFFFGQGPAPRDFAPTAVAGGGENELIRPEPMAALPPAS